MSLATFDLFTRVVPANPFFAVVFADWLSRMPTLGWAAKRYGVDPEKVGDGMDTWHALVVRRR
jgi:hypothetical protein